MPGVPTVRRQGLQNGDVGGLPATADRRRARAVIGRLHGAIEGGARSFDEGNDGPNEQ